ncbi:MAG: hypothetical protein JWP35_371 [Caulobacter sp.]|nr:hypothetical protein [Caulobacter sp.]
MILTLHTKAARLALIATLFSAGGGAALSQPAPDKEAWQIITRNPDGIGLLDVAHIIRDGPVTRIHIAVILAKPVEGVTIVANTEEVRCADHFARQTGATELYDADGKLMNTVPAEANAAFQKLQKGSNLDNVVAAACKGPPDGQPTYEDLGQASHAVSADQPGKTQT